MLDVTIQPVSTWPYLNTDSTFMVQLKAGSAVISSDGVGNKGYRMVKGEIITLYQNEQYYFVNPDYGLTVLGFLDNTL